MSEGRTVTALAAVVLSVCTGCAQFSPAPSEITVDAAEVARAALPPGDIDDGWPLSTLTAEGIDPHPIARLLKQIDTGGYTGIDGVVMARHGNLVLDRYFGDFGPRVAHQTRSTFKSVTGLLAGIAVADGVFDLNEPIAPLIARFHAPDGVDPRKRAITVRHLLQMQSGFDCDEMPGRGPERESKANEAPDPLAAHFGVPMAGEPGKRWRYCSANTYLLGVALKAALFRSTDYKLPLYLDEKLFRPLGIKAYRLGGLRSAHRPMHGGARMRPRDLAKIGQLLVSQGRWTGGQVVPASWIDSVLRDGVETGWSWTRSVADGKAFRRTSLYRHQWFTTVLQAAGQDHRLVHSWGNGGQFIVAAPEERLVFVVTGSNYGWKNVEKQKQVFHMLHRYVLPALQNAPA